ncbi:MAG: hypothetical protein M1353_13245 [Nitrospirae bacterium]|nr:hypothetical protein [Nitrospirota bacterium]
MKVKYTGESKTVTTVEGNDTKLDNGLEAECMEKEYHSGAIVRITLGSGERVKVKRSELQKV